MTRVAAAQFEVGTDVAANLAACLRAIDAAADQRADLVVLPEFCNHLSWYTDRAQAHALACRPGDAFLTAIADKARSRGIHVKLNVTMAHPDGSTGGTNVLIDPTGATLGVCDKQTLMGAENDHLNPGTTEGPVIDTPLGRIGMYACMEGVLNEVARGLALRGAQVLLNSLNSFATDEASLHIPVRAAENKVWVVAANKVGPLLPAEHLPAMSAGLGVPPEWLHGAGESQIVAPDGTVVAKAPRTGEAVVVADIDPMLADDKRRPDGTDLYATRRPALYRTIAEPPRGRQAPAGAPSLPVAVVRGPDILAATAAAAQAGARLIVLPEQVGLPLDRLAQAVAGRDAHVVTTLRLLGAHVGVLIDGTGIIGRQRQLHPSSRLPWLTDLGDGLSIFELPWGRLAIVVGDDAAYPEIFRMAALADTDVVAVSTADREPWEHDLGLLERAAENRLNVVVATPLGEAGAIHAMTGDFTLWTRWEGPFTGRISHPVVTAVKPDEAVVRADVAPAQAANRRVSRNTDLVDGRPWRLVDALTN